MDRGEVFFCSSPSDPLHLQRSLDANLFGRLRWAIGVLLSGMVLLPGCGSSEPAAPPQRHLLVAVAIEPVAFLVDRLAGPNVQVQVLIPAGADAHTFQLSPRQMADLGQADLFFRVGLALEDRILEKLRQTRPDFPVVDLARGIARRRFRPEEGHRHVHPGEDACGHGHADACCHPHPEGSGAEDQQAPANSETRQQDPDHSGKGPQDHADSATGGHCREDHAHGGPAEKHGSAGQPEGHGHEHPEGELAGADPHIWLSPPLLKEQVRRIAQALVEHDPARAAEYRHNLARLEAELDGLHAWISQQLAPYRGRTFLVFHPSFGYFADCYGLRQRAVQQEGKTPTPQELRQLIQQAQSDRVSIILVQPQFDRRAAQVVAEAIGARLVQVNDLDRHVLETLKKLTQALVEAFSPAPSSQSSS